MSGLTSDPAALPGNLCVWLASPEARFLRGKLVWSNWDMEEILQRADEIRESNLLALILEGVSM
jgi:hypothetical protein